MNDSKNIEHMRDICSLTKQVLDHISPFVVAGVTTNRLNDLCEEYTRSLEAESAPLNYHGFPKSICTSVNHVICHGIPDDIPLKDGDIVNIDVTLKKQYDGVYHYGDSSRMFTIGNVKRRHVYLCEVTKRCLDEAIKIVKPGQKFSEIGRTIEAIAVQSGFSVVREYCGHGIGTEFHMAPQILHYRNDLDDVMEEGMTFTIEPMLTEGKASNLLLEDGWTVITKDRKFSAQYEHTILITRSGYEVLT
jgi:methionyl aminopeptidase